MVPVTFWSWLTVATACTLYELWGARLLSLPFGLGALAAAVVVLLGGDAVWQWGLFFAVTLAAEIGALVWLRLPTADSRR